MSTSEQDKAMEALSLRDGGFLRGQNRLHCRTDKAEYLVRPDGTAIEIVRVKVTPLQTLEGQVY